MRAHSFSTRTLLLMLFALMLLLLLFMLLLLLLLMLLVLLLSGGCAGAAANVALPVTAGAATERAAAGPSGPVAPTRLPLLLMVPP